jgi:hypothetical protein
LSASVIALCTFWRTTAFAEGHSIAGGQEVESEGSGLKSPDVQPFFADAGSSKSLNVKNVRCPDVRLR